MAIHYPTLELDTLGFHEKLFNAALGVGSDLYPSSEFYHGETKNNEPESRATRTGITFRFLIRMGTCSLLSYRSLSVYYRSLTLSASKA